MKLWLERIAAAGQDLHRAYHSRRVVSALLHWAAELFQAECALWIAPDSRPGQLRLSKLHPRSRHALQTTRVPARRGWEAWLWAQKKALRFDHPQPETWWPKTPAWGFEIRTLMAVPVRHRQRRLGLLIVANRKHGQFLARQMKWCEAFADQAGLALANARLRETQQKYLEMQKQQLLETTVQLRQANEKLRQAELTRSEGLSMVAHELRSPITSLLGFAKLLRDGRLGALAPEQLELVSSMHRNVEAMERLISDLLDLTRMELGKLTLRMGPCSGQRLLHEAAVTVGSSLPGLASRLQFKLQEEPAYVQADQMRLLQVLVNLLTNAAKYAPSNSPIILELHADAHSVLFSVSDHGRPLAPHEQERLFEKFVRLKSDPYTGATSSGLGLAICRSIVQAHGGMIWVESAAGQGNRFCFRLERVPAPAALAAVPGGAKTP
ncbi:MAG: ATP-binding protein [candidate division FCPU426 bacterium]